MDFLGVTNKKAVLGTGKTTLNSELNYLGTEAETLQNASRPVLAHEFGSAEVG